MLSNKHRTVLITLAAIVLGIAIIFGASAATASAAQSAIPGDTLYPAKITLEQIRLSLVGDAVVRAELQLEFAERRLEEVKSLIAEGRYQNIQDTTLEFEIHINNALAELDIIIDGDPALAVDILKRITDTLTRYTDTLNELVSNIPEPVKTEVLHTISDVSSRLAYELSLGGRSGWSGFSDNCTFGSVSIDELNVPQNATCTLNGTRVEGNIYVQGNATLLAYDVWVGGNIQADRSARVEVHSGSYVGGNIQVDYSGLLLVSSVTIDGNLQAFDNWGSQSYAGNTIGGDLQAFDNSGGVAIQNNTIEGNLQCKDNYPAPTGDGNSVYGNKEDQCSDLYSDNDNDNYNDNGNSNDNDNTSDNCTFGSVSIDELNVPQNATCTLNGTRVEGNIFVNGNATLLAYDVWVGGNIQADRSARVEVHSGSYVGGNIQVDYSGLLLVSLVTIDGNLQAFDNWGSQSYAGNTIGGDLQAFDNSGGVSIQNNTVEGNLQCKDNYPAPTVDGNSVYGNMEDQCSDLYRDDDNGDSNDDDQEDSSDKSSTSDNCTFGSVSIDELNVPQNATCTLNGTRVEGNIYVQGNATLLAYDVWVGGNIQADRSAQVEVHSGSYVGGNIQVDYGGLLLVSSVVIDGNLQAFDNWGSQSYAGNTIGGDLQAFDNSGGVSIQNNTIEGNLQCKDNYPAPTGDGNSVYGNKEDQCSDL